MTSNKWLMLQSLDSSITEEITHKTLTHWGRAKMAAIFQTTFSNGFSLMKMYLLQLKFHWNLFLRIQLTIFQHWSAPSHYLNQWWLVNTPFTQGLRPLCLPCATTKLSRSPLKAEGRQNDCLGRSRVVHRTFRHRHGRHGRREVLSMFKTVAQRSPRRSVAHRSLKGGRMKAHTSPWSQNGRTVVGHWSPS